MTISELVLRNFGASGTEAERAHLAWCAEMAWLERGQHRDVTALAERALDIAAKAQDALHWAGDVSRITDAGLREQSLAALRATYAAGLA